MTRILVVDDAKVDLVLVRSLLEGQGKHLPLIVKAGRLMVDRLT